MLVRQVQVEQQQVGAQPVHRRDRLGRRMRLRDRLESVPFGHVRGVNVRDAEVVVDDQNTDHGVTRACSDRLPGPATGVLARADWVASHQAVVQKVVDGLVATMHWISTHSVADIANAMPPAFVSNGLTTKAAYVAELAQDKGQFLPNGMMPASGPPTVLAIEKFTGNVTGPVNLAGTYTNKYAVEVDRAGDVT